MERKQKQGLSKKRDIMSYKEHLAKKVELGDYALEDVEPFIDKKTHTLSKYDL